MYGRSNVRIRSCLTASWFVLSALAVTVPPAQSQSTGQPTVPGSGSGSAVPATSETRPVDGEILVVGSRASQQSANNRKKEAKTATDSIVADDIGSFPDRNVAEAISRIPGVALNRNEFGEGDSVAVRGNGPDLTRVELDGVGVTSTSGLAISSDNARSADLRELPAELVKSVDVVKGATADMTEGSLGGGIQIKTRSGLDFARPYFSLRAGVNQNSLGRKWTPDFNTVASRKFFDGRLGAIFSANYQNIQNNGHGYEQTTSNNRHYNRLFDFDNSPDKTFEYNLDTLGTDAADTVFANSVETPRTLLTKSIAAKSKADCLTALPYLSTGSNAVRSQRIAEQQTCLNQWNDYTPSNIRHFMNEQNDQRYSFDGRLDFEVSSALRVFAKGTWNFRNIRDQNRSRSPVTLFSANPAGSFVDSTTGYPRIRSVSPNAPEGYFLYGGLNNQGNNATIGNVINVRPGSIVVDDEHNVTQAVLTNNLVTINQIENISKSDSRFLQSGFEFKEDRLLVEGMAGFTVASSSREDKRTERGFVYGDATLTLQDNGLWGIELPAGYDDSDPNSYLQLSRPACVAGPNTNPATCVGQAAVNASPTTPASPQYLVSQMPLVTPSFGVIYSPFLAETSERIAKLDTTYRTEGLLPFLTQVKVGGQYRRNKLDRWGGGGFTARSAVGTFGQPGFVPAVVVPTANIRGTVRACEPTAGSSAPGGLSCNYGFVPSTNPSDVRSGTDTLTPAQLLDLFTKTLEAPTSRYFGDLPNRGNLPDAWSGIRSDVLFDGIGASQFMNFDCVKTCVGSDGNRYDQPLTRVVETVRNVYFMADFEQRLPLGLLFNGNVGVRGVFAQVRGDGLLTLTSIRTTPQFNPLDPNNAAGITQQQFVQNATVNASTNDWLPSLNMNFWGFDEKLVLRLFGGKTVARPNVNRLLPGGNCTVDQRVLIDDDGEDVYGCSGRIGNPALAPFTAWNYNASLEWYPNRDTLLSVTYGKLDVQIGNPIAVTRTDRPFAGSDVRDPVTGEPLADLEFSYPTWENGPGYQRSIWEFQAKTAFTFLPWIFRNTGADINYSRLASAATLGTRDPLTGDLMPPPNESTDYINGSLWYDDGKLNMRISYQKRSEVFNCITPCGGNSVSSNYPGVEYTNVRLPYNPGVPRFTDGTEYLDAKITYNITRSFQIFLEGRNLRREAQIISTGGYENFAGDIPRVIRQSYGGRRVMTGARVQFGNNRRR